MKARDIKKRAGELRRNPTKEEDWLWQHLKQRQVCNKKFLRQHPIVYESYENEHFFFIPDFYCHEAKLIIELDGPIHLKTRERDEQRDAILKSRGIRILRIKNEELDNIKEVIARIEAALNTSM